MKILIAGDLFISDNFQNKKLIDNSVIELFQKADIRIVNLEAPITKNNPKNKILKIGPHLQSSVETSIQYLKQLDVKVATLANNHILDYGAKGLKDTFKSLKENEIEFVGAGKNLQEAKHPYTVEKDGLKIAILNFAENEWSIAKVDKPGANPLDIIDNIYQIKLAKASHDKVICIIHGGHEYCHLPSPRMVKQYRFYADNGADAIVGHHTHCIGGYEVYNNAPIIYSLGNFLFTLPSKSEEWYTGLLAQLKIEKGRPISFELLPVQQQRKSHFTSLLNLQQKDKITHSVNELSKIISNELALSQNWNFHIAKYSKQYLNSISPTNFFGNHLIRAGLNRLGISRLLISKNYLKTLLNQLRCEAHLDATKTSIENKLLD